MAKLHGLFGVVPSTVLALAMPLQPVPDQPRTVPLTRSVKLAATKVAAPGDPRLQAQAQGSALGLWPGSEDELPVGPTGFDVTDQGDLLVTDPIFQRIAIYDKSGGFLRSWPLPFIPDSVTWLREGAVRVRDARTGDLHTLDANGHEEASRAPAFQVPPAKLIAGQNTGTINFQPAGPSNGETVQVRWTKPGLTLVSLEGIGAAANGDLFVALELNAGDSAGEAIDVRKVVRRYSSQGPLRAETSFIPLNYYVTPVDEFRVRNGVLYQLMTSSTGVQINEWDMGSP